MGRHALLLAVGQLVASAQHLLAQPDDLQLALLLHLMEIGELVEGQVLQVAALFQNGLQAEDEAHGLALLHKAHELLAAGGQVHALVLGPAHEAVDAIQEA